MFAFNHRPCRCPAAAANPKDWVSEAMERFDARERPEPKSAAELTKEIGQRLRSERERLGLSQTAFAAVGGKGRQSQIRYEAGVRSPEAVFLAAVAGIGVDAGWVISGGTRK